MKDIRYHLSVKDCRALNVAGGWTRSFAFVGVRVWVVNRTNT